MTRHNLCPVDIIITIYCIVAEAERESMKTIGIAQFKEKCLALLDHLDRNGLLITKHGKPVARVIPVATESAELIGSLKGKLKVRGKTVSTGIKWDAES